jgi:3-isopropylmalate/(R)-2-methylmalate dehydratase small subunit
VTVFQTGPQFVRHTGIAAPFMQRDVEGEYIAPVGPELHDLHAVHMDPGAAVLEPHTHDGSWAGQHAFHGFRYRPDGSEDPNFVLNQEPYRNASILLAGRSFGRGSLQAFAVIRLMQCGMRAVIAPSFGTVFYDDCFDYGLLPVTLGEEVIEKITEEVVSNPGLEMTVDLENQLIEVPGMEPVSFSIDDRARDKLLQGMSDLDEMLQHSENVVAFRSHDRDRRPWIYNLRDEVPPSANLASQGSESGGRKA